MNRYENFTATTRSARERHSVELPPFLYAALAVLGRAEGQSLTALVIRLIDEGLGRRLAKVQG